MYADRGKQREDTDWDNRRRLCWESYLLRFDELLLSSEQAEFIPLDWVKLTENCTYFCCCDSMTETTEVFITFWAPTKCPDSTENWHCRRFVLVFSWLKDQVFVFSAILSPSHVVPVVPSSWYSEQLCLPAEVHLWDRDPTATLQLLWGSQRPKEEVFAQHLRYSMSDTDSPQECFCR